MIACLYFSITAIIAFIFVDIAWVKAVSAIIWVITSLVTQFSWRRTCERIEELEEKTKYMR